MNGLDFILLFVGEIILIYFLSRAVLQRAYESLLRIGWNERMIIGAVSLLYVPGTLVHELSHFFVALILNMHPSEITIFPVVNGNRVKLGHVIYQKQRREFFRPVLVGIAPIFGALGVLWAILYFHFFPGDTLWKSILFGYLILAITANMFSSRKDLEDVKYLIPVIVIAALVYYLFPVSVSPKYLSIADGSLAYFSRSLQPALLFSVGFHAILIILLSSLNKRR